MKTPHFNQFTLEQQLAALESIPGWIELASNGEILGVEATKIRRKAQREKLWLRPPTPTEPTQ